MCVYTSRENGQEKKREKRDFNTKERKGKEKMGGTMPEYDRLFKCYNTLFFLGLSFFLCVLTLST